MTLNDYQKAAERTSGNLTPFKLIKHYEMPDDYVWLCKEKLKEIGVDVEAWNKERGSLYDIHDK